MPYCTAADVRAIANLTSTDITDGDLETLIAYATAELNSQINGKIIEEIIEYIDDVRSNDIDGSNTTFYVSKSFLWYFGDMNNDGTVDTDDIVVYEYKSDDTREQMTVSSIDENGKFVVSQAPASTSYITATYCYTPLSEQQPHTLIKKACMELSASMAFTKIQARDWDKLSLGKLTVSRGRMERAFDLYYRRYTNTIREIMTRMLKKVKADTSGMKDIITDNIKG